MKSLWNTINKLHLTRECKIKLFLLFHTVICGLVGVLLWIPIHFYALNSAPWFFFFMGYPAVFIGVFGGIIYLYNHEF